MWHIFPHGGHMEIESLRLDFQTLIITKPQNNSRAYQRRKKKKKKKNQKNLGSVRDLGCALPGSRDPSRALPGSRQGSQKKKKKNTLAIRKNSLKKEKKRKEKPNNIATLDRPPQNNSPDPNTSKSIRSKPINEDGKRKSRPETTQQKYTIQTNQRG